MYDTLVSPMKLQYRKHPWSLIHHVKFIHPMTVLSKALQHLSVHIILYLYILRQSWIQKVHVDILHPNYDSTHIWSLSEFHVLRNRFFFLMQAWSLHHAYPDNKTLCPLVISGWYVPVIHYYTCIPHLIILSGTCYQAKIELH